MKIIHEKKAKHHGPNRVKIQKIQSVLLISLVMKFRRRRTRQKIVFVTKVFNIKS